MTETGASRSQTPPQAAPQNKVTCAVAWIPEDNRTGRDLCGWIGMAASERGIRRVSLPTHSLSSATEDGCDKQTCTLQWTPLLCRAYWQLRVFLSGRDVNLTVPVDLHGTTAFQQAVLDKTRAIEPGQTSTYGQLATAVGRPRAARAVGRVMATNPVPLLVPCHRVVGGDGSLTGFGGGLAQKRALLCLERGCTDDLLRQE
jgi:methylated-DNA-[protein]-cysteine S-methyltransferase